MRNDSWVSCHLRTLRRSLGLPFVLALLASGFFASGRCLAQPASDAATNAALTGGAWVPTGKLNVARAWHTATLLLNGNVLVVGGQGSDSTVDAELYDTSTGTWSVAGSLRFSPSGHTATLLSDGQVLVLPSAELYDPDTGTWTQTEALSAGRSLHSATLLRNGKVLVAGGNGTEFVTKCELYDPATGTWSLTSPLEPVRDSFGRAINGRDLPQATLLQDGRVLMAGGTYDVDLYWGMPNAELYDPVAGSWRHAQDMHAPRLGHSATLLPNGTILVAAGDTPPYPFDPYSGPFVIRPPYSTAELFDPATESWSTTASLNVDRHDHTATLLSNGEVLVAGGYNLIDDFVVPTKSAERYDALGARWRNTSDLNVARYGHTATLLPNGKVLVVGGYGPTNGANGTLDSAELYDSSLFAAAIGPGFTGSWYDPAQSGHGFMLEVLPGTPMRLLASWFTFAPQGGQSWIVALGPVNGTRAVLQGVQTVGAGARFPPIFDAANVRQQDWGTLTFTFSDCNHGHVDWNSTAPGYGSGGMDLTRLTLPAGLTCQ